MNQLSLGLILKQEGQDRIEQNAVGFIELMRKEAIRISQTYGSVTSDDLRTIAILLRVAPHHPNAWGAIFRGKHWHTVGRKRSTIPENHGRFIAVWQWRG